MNIRRPLGAVIINALAKCFGVRRSTFHRWFVLFMTFLCYFAFHMSRRPLSVVKSVLKHNTECGHATTTTIATTTMNNSAAEFYMAEADNNCEDWVPFNGPNGKTLLSVLDMSFLVTYAVFMFVSGYVAERCNLRYFLTIGMILSGLFNYLFGMAKWYDIHSLWYFVAIQICAGILNTTGWPAVVAVVGNWFGKAKRGLIFGIWNAHTSLGNIAGAVIAGVFVEKDWGLSFAVPGFIMVGGAVLMFLFLVPQPSDVGLVTEVQEREKENQKNNREEGQSEAISFWGALKIPGVIEFSMCLFFAKLVSYTFLYWLPMYINARTTSSSEESAFIAIMFDIGGIFGGILAGYAADRTGASALTCIVSLIAAIPSLYLYYLFGTTAPSLNYLLQFVAGVFVNGPYALITTAVAAELGTKIKSKSALATVSAIIDGTGSIGAAVGPSISGRVSEIGWQYVFYMVMVADVLALVSLLRIGRNEYNRKRDKNMNISTSRDELVNRI